MKRVQGARGGQEARAGGLTGSGCEVPQHSATRLSSTSDIVGFPPARTLARSQPEAALLSSPPPHPRGLRLSRLHPGPSPEQGRGQSQHPFPGCGGAEAP